VAQDAHGRQISYLRVSLTDACNLRCRYCMPETMRFRPPAELLSDGELLRLLRLFAAAGFRKFRFTGGEPTLRPGLTELVRATLALPGLAELSLTTNGLRLPELAEPLHAAGLRRININLNTLDPEGYRAITRGGDVAVAWTGVRAAAATGLSIKLNVVAVRGFSDGESAAAMARLTLEYPWYVRFIELMPIGRAAAFQAGHHVPEDELREAIAARLGPLTPVPRETPGKASLYQLPGARGLIGFISSVSRPFCHACVRARLAADGRLRLCLLQEDEVDLLTPLRSGATDDELAARIRQGLWRKPLAHGLQQQVIPRNRAMSEIGG